MLAECVCESAEVQTVSTVKARKPWQCCECRSVIQIGESHTHYKTLFDGYWSSDRMCETCRTVSEAFSKALRTYNETVRAAWEAFYRRSHFVVYAGNTAPPPAPIPSQYEVCDCWCFGELWEHVAEYCEAALGYHPQRP